MASLPTFVSPKTYCFLDLFELEIRIGGSCYPKFRDAFAGFPSVPNICFSCVLHICIVATLSLEGESRCFWSGQAMVSVFYNAESAQFCYRDGVLAMLAFNRQRDAFYTRLRLLFHLLLLGSY